MQKQIIVDANLTVAIDGPDDMIVGNCGWKDGLINVNVIIASPVPKKPRPVLKWPQPRQTGRK